MLQKSRNQTARSRNISGAYLTQTVKKMKVSDESCTKPCPNMRNTRDMIFSKWRQFLVEVDTFCKIKE